MGYRRLRSLLPLAAAAAMACGADASGKKDAGVTLDGSTSGQAGRGAAGAGGTGGSGRGGSAGSVGSGGSSGSAGGTAGSAGAGGAPARDGGQSADAGGGDAGVVLPACTVAISAVAPPRLRDLPPGPMTVLRLRATIGGTRPPAMPTWRWTVVHETSAAIPTTRVDASTNRQETVEFPLIQPGRYDVRVEVAPGCAASEVATAFDPTTVPTPYWARVLPPPGSRATVRETTIQVLAGRNIPHTLTLEAGRRVDIDPMGADMRAESSYIRVTSNQSSVRLEGRNGGVTGSFRVVLNPVLPYDVLILPDGLFAPVLIQNELPDRLSALAFRVDGGTLVAGQLTRQGGGPVEGAKVLLRAGDLPSSTGTSAAGAYRLSARPGSFGVVVVPPPGSGLPEAVLPQGDGIQVASTPVTLDLRWDTLPTTPARLTVRTSDGAVPGRPVRVRLESGPDGLGRVGEFTIDGRSVPAPGVIRVEAITDATGQVVFPALPRAAYLATLAPSDALAKDGVTTVPLDLITGNGTKTVATMPKVQVAGRLVPATRSAGATVVAVDVATDAPDALISQRADPTGSYVLDLAPGRTYRLFVEPQPERGVPGVPLGLITVGARATPVDERVLPVGMPIAGTVLLDGIGVSGALVQLFCIGVGPDCVNTASPSVELVRPLSETTANASGAFGLVVPDPGNPR